MSKEVLIELLIQNLSKGMNIAVEKVTEIIHSSSSSQSQPHPGSIWITSVEGPWLSHNGFVVSAYFHPSRPHTASTIGKLGTKKSAANAG